jgi:hypothetical protein
MSNEKTRSPKHTTSTCQSSASKTTNLRFLNAKYAFPNGDLEFRAKFNRNIKVLKKHFDDRQSTFANAVMHLTKKLPKTTYPSAYGEQFYVFEIVILPFLDANLGIYMKNIKME